MITSTSNKTTKGYLIIFVLVFGAIFFTITTSFIAFIVTQSEAINQKYQSQRALEISEAGLNYYRWFLSHFVDDVTNGTGLPGPYVHQYSDPEGGVIGEFSLEIASSTYCGEVSSIEVWSTGHTYDDPAVERTIYARYALPTVSEYAYIINSAVWAGPDRTIIGPYHSNSLIRMDGTNNSVVTSGQEDWVCDNNTLNCDPPYNEGDTLDAVFGSGPNNHLWSFPSATIDFSGINVDLAIMQNKAQTGGGIYLGPSGDQGYRVRFMDDNTIDVYVVDSTYNYWGYNSSDGWQTERNVISDDDYLASYDIPADCPLIYVEDKVWLEGEVASNVSLAAADTDTFGVDRSIILNDDITYSTSTAGLLAVAEEDVLVGLVVPDDMVLNGIFIAQSGRFGRNHYKTTGNDVLSFHDGYVERDSLTMTGTIVSNGRVGTKWVSGSTFISGFEDRYNSYDRRLVDDPPPLVPRTSDVYKFIEWREER